MSRTLVIVLLAVLLAGCAKGTNPAADRSTTVQWDSVAAQQVQAQVEKTMGAFASMDLAGFKSGLSENVVGFEVDMDGKPIRLGSRAEAGEFAENSFAQLTKMGANPKLDFHSSICHATSTLAYCTVEFDFKISLADGSTVSQPTRNSIVLEHSDDGWRWIHWHSSPAGPPAASSPGSAKSKP